MKTTKILVCLLVVLTLPQLMRANLVGPYTPDANTLFLCHFDEPAGSSSTTNVGIKGGNFITVTNTLTGNGVAEPPTVTTLLGHASYTNTLAAIGFGNAVCGTNVDGLIDGLAGYDGNKNGTYDADVSGGPASPDAINLTNLNIGFNGASPFTIEALVCPNSITASLNQEIVCTDDGNGTRGFQFKITTAGQLQFNLIPISGGNITFSIPTTGTHAFVPGHWYHVAAVYDGTKLSLYWTQLDPSNNVANLLGATTVNYNSSSPAAPLVIAAENRGSDQESFQGLVDEVRISSVARAANQMQFFSPTVTIGTQPASQNIDDGQPVTFTVNASSLTQLGYQWRFNGAGIPGATTNSYSIAAVNQTNAGKYDIVITNTSGNSATSSPAMLVVGAANFLSHRWSFTSDTSDSIGGAWGTNFGDATVSGGALVLDGTAGTYMQIPNLIGTTNIAMTFEFWANFATNNAGSDVFSFGNTNFTFLGVPGYPENYVLFSPHTAGSAHAIGISGGTFEAEQDVTGTGTLDGNKVHVTCVVDPPNSTIALYTNGVLEAMSTSISVPLASLGDTISFIGRSLTNIVMNGSIDEFRIYNGALNANSVLQSQLIGPNTLLEDGPVQLVNQPASTTIAPGFTVTLSGLAEGYLPITYQWLENGSAILGATNSSYSFIAASGQNGHNFQLVASNIINGTNYFAASTNATLTVITPTTLAWVGANGNPWDTSTLNWTNPGSGTLSAYVNFDGALFDNRGASQPSVNLTFAATPLTVTVDSTANYSFSSALQNGSLSGPGSLTKNNTDTLTIDVADTMTGPVAINGGTLQIGNGDTLGGIGSPVTNNASLVLDRSDATTLSSPISGTGTVTMNLGNVTATGSNSYTGGTFINNGITFLASSTGLGATNSAITMANNNNAELYITANVDIGPKPLIVGGTGVSGAGALRKGGAGATTYNGPVTLTGNTTFAVDSGATLTLTNASGVDGSGANASLTLAGSGAGNIDGPMSLGSGSLTVSGGTWTVGPSNNFTGLTTINAGGLFITGPLSLGPVPGSFDPSDVTLNGGVLGAGANVTLNDGNIGIQLGGNAAISVVTNATFVISNQISATSGALTLTKTGPGTLVLQGANPFGGTLNVDSASTTANDGMLVIANNGAIANIPAIAGLPFIFFGDNNAGRSTLALDGTLGSITIAPDIQLTGRNVTIAAIENIIGNNIISGDFELTNGGGDYIFQSDAGTLTMTAPLPFSTPTSSTRTVTFQGTGGIVMSGGIQDGSFNGTSNIAVNVIFNGPGLLSLPVANSYSGFTGVSNGVLSLTGSLKSIGGVTVGGGLLVGNGSITGPVTVVPGGAIEAGATNAIGTLTLGSSLTLSGNTIFKINKTAGTHDLFSGQTSVTYGGTLTVTNLSGTLVLGDSFTLFTPGASASNFSNISGSAGAGLAYSFANGVLSVVKGPATNPTNILFSVNGNVLTLSWPADHLGWTLQTQTNALNVGLSTNWVSVPNSASVTSTNITMNPASPTVFYRLIFSH
jgi:autotransporter-associated beta strand protein